MQTVTFESYVDWKPDMSVVKLHAQCDYTLAQSAEALSKFSEEIDMFTRFATEHCLREIANDSIKTVMIVSPERQPQGGGMYGKHTRFKAEVIAVNRGDAADVMHVDELQKAIHGAFWKQIALDSRRSFDERLAEVSEITPE